MGKMDMNRCEEVLDGQPGCRCVRATGHTALLLADAAQHICGHFHVFDRNEGRTGTIRSAPNTWESEPKTAARAQEG